MATVPQLAHALRRVLTTAADAAAHASGCVQRRSKLTGAVLVQTLVFGWLHRPQASLGELAQTAASLGVPITPQGLDQRFTAAAATCLQQVLHAAIQEAIATAPVAIPLLQRFPAVLVQDSSTIALPDALAAVWPGCGGRVPQGSAAALKVQVQLDLCSGRLHGPELQGGRVHDLHAALATAPLPVGALRLADLGFFDLPRLQALDHHGGYWLSRLKLGTTVSDPDGTRWDLPRRLAHQPAVLAEYPVRLGVRERVAARLIAVRLPQAVVDERRRKWRAAARRAGKTVSRQRRVLAAWNLFITNVPPAQLSAEEALVLARARWQIELLFKLWKQHGGLDAWRSDKPWRVLCEVYAKLLAVLVQHWLSLAGCWAVPDRSLVKAAQSVRRESALLTAAFAGVLPLTRALRHLLRALGPACRLNPRRQQPNTYQLLCQPTANRYRAAPGRARSSGPGHSRPRPPAPCQATQVA